MQLVKQKKQKQTAPPKNKNNNNKNQKPLKTFFTKVLILRSNFVYVPYDLRLPAFHHSQNSEKGT